MRIKCQPEDFRVCEATQTRCEGGPFAFYRLTKRSLGTPEAVDAICRRWNIPAQQVQYGGLKDRHAVTAQHLTIYRGPRRGLKETNLRLEYLGQTSRAFGPQDIDGNEFQVVLRDIRPEDAERLQQHIAELPAQGLPNYFDEQRFGSVGVSGQFVAREWCLGNYEAALQLALAEDNRHDRPQDRRDKLLLREHWGQWPHLKSVLPRSHRRSIVTYLVDHPQDFRRALALIRVDLRRLYLSAFQSYLWNDMLSRLLVATLPAETVRTVSVGPGTVALFLDLDQRQRDVLRVRQLPLPAARQKVDEELTAGLLAAALEPFVLSPQQLRVKYPRDSFFSKGHRHVLFFPERVQCEVRDDEIYEGRRAICLSFLLPRGSYATMVVKWLDCLQRGGGTPTA
jgi:tRNA pseudouridine13 synthase